MNRINVRMELSVSLRTHLIHVIAHVVGQVDSAKQTLMIALVIRVYLMANVLIT